MMMNKMKNDNTSENPKIQYVQAPVDYLIFMKRKKRFFITPHLLYFVVMINL
jgi:hypothetical protein